MDGGSATLTRLLPSGGLRPALYLLPLVFLGAFFFYPLAAILLTSFAPQGNLDLSAIQEAITSPVYLEVMGFTLGQAILSTLLTLALGLPAAQVFAKYQFPGKRLFQALTTIPFVLPAVVVAAALTALLGPRGRINEALMVLLNLDSPPIQLQHTLGIILLAHVFYNYTLVLRLVGSFWANIDPRIEEAARVLGASRRQALFKVTLPLLRPAIYAAALLTFIFCFTSFGVILILGGPRFATLEVEIYRQSLFYLDLPLAGALSFLQLVFTTAAMVLYTRLQSRWIRPLNLRPQRFTAHPPRTVKAQIWVAANLILGGFFLLSPLVALVDRSFSLGEKYDLSYYQALFLEPRRSILFVPPWEAIRNSLLVATTTVILAVGFGVIAADLLARRRDWLGRLLDPLFMLPLGTSAVTLGFGFLIALDEPPLNLRASPLLLPLAHTLVALPFVVRSILPVLQSIHPHLREAAASLGASPRRVLREIDLPIVGRAILVGAVFAFSISMGEFGATALIARPEFPTMPVAIFRFLGQPGELNYGQALAMGTLLMLVVGSGILAIERFRFRGMGEF